MEVLDPSIDDPSITIIGSDGDDEIVVSDHVTNDTSHATVEGGKGNDTIHGGDLNSELYGGEGDDTIYGGSVWDYLCGNEGDDTIYAGSASYNLVFGGIGDDRIYTGKFYGEFYGEQGNDTLDASNANGQSDYLVGGDGNDIYIISEFEMIWEEKDGGIDTVRSSITYSLDRNDWQHNGGLNSDYIEDLVLTGTDNIDGFGNDLDNELTGNSGNNKLYGGAGDDTLVGGDGNDLLDGGTGADTMIGGRGQDRYIVDSADDIVFEDNNNAVETVPSISGRSDWLAHFMDTSRTEVDTVVSSVDYTLGRNVELLELTGSRAINGTGNELDNAITGNGKDNVLKGMAGSDKLWGGGGNDTLDGGTGDDWLDGGSGHDILTGGAGRDSFVFGANFALDRKTGIADLGYINASSDTVKDFVHGEDLILLSMKAFGLTGNVGDMLDAKTFRDYAYANTADQRILYDAKTGELWFDHNGNGSDPMGDGTNWTGRRLIATFTDDQGHHPVKLDISDFMLIA